MLLEVKNLNKKFGNLPKSIPLTEQKFISDETDEQESLEIINNAKKIASRIINGLSYKEDWWSLKNYQS